MMLNYNECLLMTMSAMSPKHLVRPTDTRTCYIWVIVSLDFKFRIWSGEYCKRRSWPQSIPDSLVKMVSRLNKFADSKIFFHSLESHKIKFRDSQFLVLVNRILALVFSVGALLVRRFQRKTPLASNLKGTTFAIAPLYEFVFCSLSNILSSWCQYEALKFVNFPTQVRRETLTSW